MGQGSEFSSLSKQFRTSMAEIYRRKSKQHDKYVYKIRKALTNTYICHIKHMLSSSKYTVLQVETGWIMKKSRQFDLQHGRQQEVNPAKIALLKTIYCKVSCIIRTPKVGQKMAKNQQVLCIIRTQKCQNQLPVNQQPPFPPKLSMFHNSIIQAQFLQFCVWNIAQTIKIDGCYFHK